MNLKILVFFIAGPLYFSGQLSVESRPKMEDKFVVYISANSSIEKINAIESELQSAGFNIEIDEFIVNPENVLESFHVQFDFQCQDKPHQYHESTIDMNAGELQPIAVIFIGEDCSNGSFNTSYDRLPELYNLFYRDKDPAHSYYAWEGSFDSIKDVLIKG